MIMDQDRELMDELERLQSSIATLFKSVLNDNNKYKHEKDMSKASVESLMIEISVLKKENEQLKKCNNAKITCMTCSELREQLVLHSTKTKKLEKTLDILREMLCNWPCQDGNVQLLKLLSRKLDDLRSDISYVKYSSSSVDNEASESREEDNLVTYRTFLEEIDSTKHKEKNGDRKINQTIETQGEESYQDLISSNSDFGAVLFKRDNEFNTPRKGDKSGPDFISSPFCSISGIKKEERSPVLVDQRFGINKNMYPSSPSYQKRRDEETVRDSPVKYRKKNIFQKSPSQRKYSSPVKGSRMKSSSQLKSANSIEAEVSFAGVRKLKQTQLNPDYYRTSSTQDNEKASTSKYNENLNEENKFGEDDVILESPKHVANYSDKFKKTLWEEDWEEAMTLEEEKHSKPVLTGEVYDPEETFVSSILIRDSARDVKLPKAKEISAVRSPEYNTVPYPYKGSPVRTKAERMRLPGHMCAECSKYYKAILGEVDPEKLQEILNQCSRHREEHYNISETPPGYWKPFLTATMDNSAAVDDDTHFDD